MNVRISDCLVRVFPETALVEVLVSQGCGCQPEDHAAVGTNDGLGVFSVTAEVLQVAAAASVVI